MEVEKHGIDISLAVLWKVLTKNICILLIVGIVGFALIFSISELTYVPQYESTAKLFILRDNPTGAGGSVVDDNAYVVSEMVAVDCDELIHGRTVLQAVVDELGDPNLTWQELEKRIETDIPVDSRNLSVTVRADSPEEAQLIVNTLCRIADEKIEEILGERQARFYEEGELIKEPCNDPSLLTMGLVALLLMVVTYVGFVAAYVLNDYVGSNDEIEKRVQLPVLGDIPSVTKRGVIGHYYVYGERRTKGKYRNTAKYESGEGSK